MTGALVGGAIGMRLSGWVEHLHPAENPSLVEAWAFGARSILGGLLGAYLGVLLAKRLIGYTGKTGDLFAPAVAAGMAVGRIGCLLTEAPGRPTGLPWGVHGPPDTPGCPGCLTGAAMHPSFAYEIAFQAAAFATLLWLRPRVTRPGELFTLYVAAICGVPLLRRVHPRQRDRVAESDSAAMVPDSGTGSRRLATAPRIPPRLLRRRALPRGGGSMTTPPYPPYPPEPEPERWQPPPGGNRSGNHRRLRCSSGSPRSSASTSRSRWRLILVSGTAGSNPDLTLQIAAGALILITFGGGLALLLKRKPWATGMGLGLMIGWALMSVVTAGYCTGINPELYA